MSIYGKPLAGICVSTAIFVCGAAGYPTAPADLPPSTGSLQLETTTGDATELQIGADVALSGGGFAEFAAVTIAVYSSPTELAQVISDEGGDIDTVVTLPSELSGEHTLTAIGNDSNGDPHSLQVEVNLVAQDPGTAPGEEVASPIAVPDQLASLPRTGIRTAAIFAGGLGLMLAGFALLRSTVYRRKFLPV